MNRRSLILFILSLFVFTIITALPPSRGGGGGGGRIGGGGGRMNGGGHTLQRSPSMSRSYNPRVGTQTGTRQQIQQFARNNPVQTQVRINNPNIRHSNTVLGNNVRNNVYNHYPNRNQWFNNRANLWGASTALGVGAWLGYQAQPNYYGYNDGNFGVVEAPPPPPTPQSNYFDPSQIAAATNPNYMPLGVFSISKNSTSLATPNLFLQLGVSKDGMISGTFYNAQTNESYDVEGSVDSSSQRALWKVASAQGGPVVETGIYNLTQDEAPIRIHFPNGQVQEGLLVRINA